MSRMQARLARSWSSLRYGLSAQRALDNADRNRVEHARVMAEIDELVARLDAVLPVRPESDGSRAAGPVMEGPGAPKVA